MGGDRVMRYGRSDGISVPVIVHDRQNSSRAREDRLVGVDIISGRVKTGGRDMIGWREDKRIVFDFH